MIFGGRCAGGANVQHSGDCYAGAGTVGTCHGGVRYVRHDGRPGRRGWARPLAAGKSRLDGRTDSTNTTCRSRRKHSTARPARPPAQPPTRPTTHRPGICTLQPAIPAASTYVRQIHVPLEISLIAEFTAINSKSISFHLIPQSPQA